MSDTQTERKPLRRQMDTYRELWKDEHEAVQKCWILEDKIRIGVATFHLFREAERSWRDRVFRGADSAIAEAGEFFHGMYREWLMVTEHNLERVAVTEKSYAVDGADELRAAESEARSVVAGWQLPAPTRTIGMRDLQLPPEAADNLRRILGENEENPAPLPAGSVPKTISLDEFLATNPCS